jgi:lipopolysaccharide transport system ATP-binding protein
LIRDRLGSDVFGTNSYHLNRSADHVEPGESLLATFTAPLNLGPGSYSVAVAVHTERTHHERSFDWWDRALVFEVVPNDAYHFVGTARLPVELALERTPTATLPRTAPQLP